MSQSNPPDERTGTTVDPTRDADWIDPAPADGTNGAVLAAHHVESWRTRGFAFVAAFLPGDLLTAARDDALSQFPAPGSDAAAAITQFGSGQRFVFPAASDAFNRLTLHPDLSRAVAELLGVPARSLRLTQSDLWPKYGRSPSGRGLDNADQRIHCDYPNHTLTHPPPWDAPEAVEIIIYLSDHDDCAGATAVVPRDGDADPAYAWPIDRTPGVAGFDYVNDRASAERYLRERAPEVAGFREAHLYARERQARYRFGSVLFYRHDTWHRGTEVRNGALRIVHNLTFRNADSEWIGVIHPGWAWSMYGRGQTMEKLIAQATVQQRCLLGFPEPGHAYWTQATVDAVDARYAAHDIDMTPYREALPG